MNRETIAAALFAKLATLSTGGSPLFKTTGRRLLHWNDVPAESQPALYQIQKSEQCARTRGKPPLWKLQLSLYVYVHTMAQSDSTIVPSQLLNPLLDAVETALAPDDLANDACSLGGLVSSCYIDGAIETSEGLLGDQEVAIIPITIVVPS